MSAETPEPMLTKEEWMARLDQALNVVLYRDLLVRADSLLSLIVYRGAGSVDDEWKADAKELVLKLRSATARKVETP